MADPFGDRRGVFRFGELRARVAALRDTVVASLSDDDEDDDDAL
jgi:hypothetical protein